MGNLRMTVVKTKNVLILIAISMLSGCGISEADIENACDQANGSDNIDCACVADKAMEDLSEEAQALFYATLTEDQETIEQLIPEMNAADATQAGVFMLTAALECISKE